MGLTMKDISKMGFYNCYVCDGDGNLKEKEKKKKNSSNTQKNAKYSESSQTGLKKLKIIKKKRKMTRSTQQRRSKSQETMLRLELRPKRASIQSGQCRQ